MLCLISLLEVVIMTDQQLLHIERMLKNRHRDRHTIMKENISERLNKSLFTYISDLDNSIEYIKTKKDTSVIKKL